MLSRLSSLFVATALDSGNVPHRMVVLMARKTEKVATPFSEWLARRLEKAGFNQSSFARELDTTHGVVWGWLNRGIQPSPEMCERIARVLDVSATYVLELADHIPVGSSLESEHNADLPQWLRELLPTLKGLDEFEGRTVEATALSLIEMREARAKYGAQE